MTYTLTLTTLSPELYARLQTDIPMLLHELEAVAVSPSDKRSVAYCINNMKAEVVRG